MDATIERECSALGGLFQQIVTDMKNGAPLWEDLISKATKLHTCLRAAILAISAYLEAFQKIADAATNARGATKEIGTALTRICLRHKAVETRMKSFTSAIMDCLVLPLQEKLEDWKKSLINLDKEHAKEFKKARAELKKRSTDTLRLQKKKARKGQVHLHVQGQSQSHGTCPGDVELNRMLESSAAVVQEKRLSLEETERKAVRAALLEERGRFCLLARFLKPVLDEEIAMLMELTHLQEVSDQLQRHAASPHHLPPASEQVITDIKGCDVTQWSLATPPSSPSLSLGSRKSSMCSISSLTSSSSGSCKSHPSPSGHPWHRSLSQPVDGRVRPASISGIVTLRHMTSGSSRDSGFTSQDTLYNQPISEHQVSNVSSLSNQSTGCTVTRPVSTSTWPDLQETSVQYDRQNPGAVNERPHTISSAYEKGHQRPALSVYTFQAPDRDGSSCCHSQPASPVSSSSSCSSSNQQLSRVQLRRNNGSTRPPIPSRCSSLERPTIPMKSDAPGSPRGKPKLPLPAHLAKELATHQLQQPMYVNMHELANLAASRAQEMQLPLPPPPTSLTAPGTDKAENPERDAGSQTSESSLESSSGYGSQNTLPHSHSLHNQNENTWNVPGAAATLMARRGSMQQVTRPPPPTRRTSTVITAPPSSLNEDRNENACEEAENLPPPPAFLLEGSSPTASPTPQRSISVSETVRTLTELRHTPASPSLLRKATGQQQQQQQQQQPPHNNPIQHNAVLQISRTSVERSAVRSISQERGATAAVGSMAASGQAGAQSSQGPGGVGQGFMAVLNAKLIGTAASNSATAGASSGSPKSLRKQSLVETQQSNQKNSKSAASGFLETLNAKLAQQQQALQGGNGGASRSASVRRIMGNRVPIVDPLQVRDSLMDQIRRGTSLRKTSGPINDRSAPKIY
ncbi:PREDICTED: MTSS1-like protein isoform X2 [Dinoponera quadriceps]|uniref:MTSS1-like protein isoform X2 n=1 Tax=Dinoponera quadriceps TaxID=609295 RepID=A0A6P3XY53_DINQU|nr:PREDICTED: MTSS1-like protein isoform X2 [Dinoponera quadriceps]